MARKIIYPIIVFLTLLASANVRSVPLFVLAIAEIIFACLMIISAKFTQSRLKFSPVQSILHLHKGESCECMIKVENSSALPVSRFRLELAKGYHFFENELFSLFGGTDKKEGFLKVAVDNPYCGIHCIRLLEFKTFDPLLLSSFKNKLGIDVSIFVLPDPSLKMNILPISQNNYVNVNSGEGNDSYRTPSGADISDIRPYREGDRLSQIYWKQSAKMNTLWVREFSEDVSSYPVIEVDNKGFFSKTIGFADGFYRILYALMNTSLSMSSAFIFRHTGGKTFTDYLINDFGHIKEIIISFYKEDFSSLSAKSVNAQFIPTYTIRMVTPELNIFNKGKLIASFDETVTDEEIMKTTLKLIV